MAQGFPFRHFPVIDGGRLVTSNDLHPLQLLDLPLNLRLRHHRFFIVAIPRKSGVNEPLALGLGLPGAEASGSVAVKREKKELEPGRLSGSAVESAVLDHHVVEVFVVGDRYENVEIFAGKLVLEVNGVIRGVAEGGKLRDENKKLDIAIDNEDFGVTADVGKLVVMGAGLDFAVVAAHELDFVVGGYERAFGSLAKGCRSQFHGSEGKSRGSPASRHRSAPHHFAKPWTT
ncbi:hypothetical protein C1H46_001899 [Malus baccata]|uniref:Uncharacterized protein n=1 Tax=Malus baccata TaxID=106549 RepID=A0A540NN95_MALBA|nr:hypothetical protein C1H46_001899 [Malus baccata]